MTQDRVKDFVRFARVQGRAWSLTVGQTVSHGKYGTGVIVGADAGSGELRIHIRFHSLAMDEAVRIFSPDAFEAGRVTGLNLDRVPEFCLGRGIA